MNTIEHCISGIKRVFRCQKCESIITIDQTGNGDMVVFDESIKYCDKCAAKITPMPIAVEPQPCPYCGSRSAFRTIPEGQIMVRFDSFGRLKIRYAGYDIFFAASDANDLFQQLGQAIQQAEK